MATVKQIIEKAYTKVNGEYEQVIEGSDDFNTYLNVLNQSMEALAHMPYIKWQRYFDIDYRLPEKIEQDKLAYIIPDINKLTVSDTPYDCVRFIDDQGKTVAEYKLIDNAKFNASEGNGVCTLAGDKIRLKNIPEKLVGCEISLPVYHDPKVYTSGSEEVDIDSVPWLVATMSATLCDASPVPFIARNADRYYKQADIFMKEMRKSNKRTQTLIIKSVIPREPKRIVFKDM